MFIRDYKVLTPTVSNDGYNSIPGLVREGYTTAQYMEMVDSPVLSKPTAVLYAGGFNVHQSENRDITKTNSRYVGSIPWQDTTMVIKESTAYSLHKWIGAMENNELVVHASINSNTCASSMHSLYEAQRLLDDGVCEEVVIIAEEKTGFNTLRIFKEHRIDITCGDGFAMVVLTNEDTGIEITDTKWAYQYNSNPFMTTSDGYKLVDSDSDVVKVHGTGTETNNVAEEGFVGSREVVNYKNSIGHTQGVSGLLEVLMVLDDGTCNGRVLCVSSGLGGFYGSCVVHKH